MINNPYQTTPMMNNNYMPMQNPYADRMNFLQSYQQSLQQPVAGTQMSLANQQPMPQQIAGINGRIVQAVENINANEVPMDGSMAFFPKQDMSEIYVKGWNADGTIRTIVYKMSENSRLKKLQMKQAGVGDRYIEYMLKHYKPLKTNMEVNICKRCHRMSHCRRGIVYL